MNVLIEQNSQYGLVVSSRVVAKELGKLHKDVLESLRKILESGDFRSLIIPSTYKAEGQKRSYKEYLLTKDGFTLYMFNIQGYQDFKIAYIQKFNEMEKILKEKAVPFKPVASKQKKIKFEPVKIYKTADGMNVINGRELWNFLQIKNYFSAWIKKKIEKYDYMENEDYICTEEDYALSLDMAKELSIMENTSYGRIIRKYIISYEKEEYKKLNKNNGSQKKIGYLLTNNLMLRHYGEKLHNLILSLKAGETLKLRDFNTIQNCAFMIKNHAFPLELDKKYGIEQDGLITFKY